MTDRLTLTRALEGSGMQSGAAERIATEIYDAIHDNVATKADLAALDAALKSELAVAVRDLKIWTGWILAAGLGLLFTALHYWPPRG
jgi:hypothetical protein